MSSKLKYYFAVNNAYVAKKLGLLLFPFAHTVSCIKLGSFFNKLQYNIRRHLEFLKPEALQ